MAVPEQTPYSEHTGNGVTKSFSLDFICESKDHLIVLVDDVEPPIATWSLSGGNVEFITAPASGSKITLQRNTPFGRTTEYQSFNNSFRPQSVNGDFDRLWLKLQELGVGDWLLKLYVDRLHQQQEQEINDLKDYVDDRDDELRAYLMEEIRKQGVALDQLDDYYNYLMQRLAQIAVDKGWDAAFVVDASGKNQQEINDSIGANWRNKPTGYGIGDKVRLLNGALVESITTANTSNPNTDMTNWIDSSRTEFSANLVDYLSRQDYKRMLNLDKTLDITTALQSILTKFHTKRTDGSDTYSNAQGICKVRLPKGVFVLSDTITMPSPLGLIFEGDGVATTVLLYKKDSGSVFNFQTYQWLEYRDMSIIHQPVSADKTTWTNTLFNLNGTGGGKRFKLRNVYTVGFNYVQRLNHNVNEDTNYGENCQFNGFNKFLYSRSSQAVNNSYSRCAWTGHGTVFDVANYGHTQISDSGIIVGGSWFKLADATLYGPTAQFILTNVKGEWMNAETGSQSLGTTKIISAADSATLSAYFKFIKCGIAGGSPDPLVNHFDLQTNGVTIDVDGGEWSGVNIATKSKSYGTDRVNRSWIRFANCTVAPNRKIVRIVGEGDSSHQPVIFENNSNCFDIVMLGTGLSTSRLMTPSKVENHNTIHNRFGRILYNPSASYVIETYGQRVNIEDVKIYVASSVGTVNCKATFYTDSGKTNSIGEVSIPASASPQVIPVPLTGSTVTTEGLYIDVVADNNSNIPGYIKCKSVSF